MFWHFYSFSDDGIAHFCWAAHIERDTRGLVEVETRSKWRALAVKTLTGIRQNWWAGPLVRDQLPFGLIGPTRFVFKRFAATNWQGVCTTDRGPRNRDQGPCNTDWGPPKGRWKEHPFNKSARAAKTINIGNLTESTVWHSTGLQLELGIQRETGLWGTQDWGSIIHLVVHDPYLLEFLVRVWRAKKYKNKAPGTYNN